MSLFRKYSPWQISYQLKTLCQLLSKLWNLCVKNDSFPLSSAALSQQQRAYREEIENIAAGIWAICQYNKSNKRKEQGTQNTHCREESNANYTDTKTMRAYPSHCQVGRGTGKLCSERHCSCNLLNMPRAQKLMWPARILPWWNAVWDVWGSRNRNTPPSLAALSKSIPS